MINIFLFISIIIYPIIYLSKNGLYSGHSHNLFLELAIDYGIFVSTIFLFYFIWLFFKSFKVVNAKENYQNKIRELPESIKQFSGLVIVTIIVISFFFILNVMFGEGDELVEKMKIEEERIAQEKKF